MAQFNVKLPSNILRADSLQSVRAFAERTDWEGLPKSASFHASAIKTILQPPGTDTSLAEEILLLLAGQRLAYYLEHEPRVNEDDQAIWLKWIDGIFELNSKYETDNYDATQLLKDKAQLSIQLMKVATSLIQKDAVTSEILYASSTEIGESAEMQMRDTKEERIKSALTIAELAQQYAFDESDKQHAMSRLSKIKAFFLGS